MTDKEQESPITQSKTAAVQLGFLLCQLSARQQAVVYLVGQKTRLDCSPRGLGLDTPGLEAIPTKRRYSSDGMHRQRKQESK